MPKSSPGGFSFAKNSAFFVVSAPGPREVNGREPWPSTAAWACWVAWPGPEMLRGSSPSQGRRLTADVTSPCNCSQRQDAKRHWEHRLLGPKGSGYPEAAAVASERSAGPHPVAVTRRQGEKNFTYRDGPVTGSRFQETVKLLEAAGPTALELPAQRRALASWPPRRGPYGKEQLRRLMVSTVSDPERLR